MGVALTDGFRRRKHRHGTSGRRHGLDADSGQGDRLRGRAMHETTAAGKALTGAYYGSAPIYSYMIECGGGLGGGLARSSEYPLAITTASFVGGHAAHLTRQIFGQLWLWTATHSNGARHSAVGEAARHSRCRPGQMRSARRREGWTARGSDRCTFDPKEIACRSADAPNCLTAPQVEAVRKSTQDRPIPERTKRSGRRFIGQRAGLEFLHRRTGPDRHCDEHAARRNSQGSRLGLSNDAVDFGPRRRAGRSVGYRTRQRIEPRHLGIRAARGKTDLGRAAGTTLWCRPARRELLQQRGGQDRQRQHTPRGSPLHGSRDD